MAHNFANAYSNVKNAVQGLVAIDPLRLSLNHASAQFTLINDGDFDKAPYLRGEFRSLRARLRRSPENKYSKNVRFLDNTDSAGMILLAEDLLSFSIKMESTEYDSNVSREVGAGLLNSIIRDSGPNNWDEDRSLD